MQIIQGLIIEIIADEGMVLTCDDSNYATHLYLGKDDSPSNWREVPIEEVSQENGEFETSSLSF